MYEREALVIRRVLFENAAGSFHRYRGPPPSRREANGITLWRFRLLILRLKILIQIAGDHTVIKLADLIGAHAVKALELWV